MKILITGGAGYIGSIAAEQAQAAGHDVAILDSTWRGHRAAAGGADFFEVDLRDAHAVGDAVRTSHPDAIMHFAAATIVPESVQLPGLYFGVNTVGSHNLITAAIEQGVERFVFSSTAAVYGAAEAEVITEATPTVPINPYGLSKLMTEQMLDWQSRATGLKVAIFRYFNVAGASERRGEDHDPESHLIPIALQAAMGRRDALTIFGTDYPTPDGTAIRDYVHVVDLADAHVLAIEWLAGNRFGTFNLGSREGFSVRQVVEAVESVTGRPLPVIEGPRRAGDPPRLVADATRARADLGWSPSRSTMPEMVRSAWDWMRANPDGYALE